MTLKSAERMRTMESTTMVIRIKDALDRSSEEAPPTTGDKRQTGSPDSVCTWPKLTNFSIDNILREDFGSTIRKHGLGHIPLHHVRCNGVGKLGVDNIFRRSVIFGSDRRRRRDAERPSRRAVTPVEKPPTSPEPPDERLPKSPESSATESPLLWPAWVYCTRYSDRPSSGPRTRKIHSRRKKDEKRPRTAFSAPQLQRLRQEFQVCNYLTEERRRSLASKLNLSESQIKIWFQNKRAKIKKANGYKNPLAMNLMTQGLYNHSTIPLHDDSSDDQL